MKKFIIIIIMLAFVIQGSSQKLYKDAFYGQNKEEAKSILADSTFRVQFGDYVFNKISGQYKKNILVCAWMNQDFKTQMKLGNLINGNRGKEATLLIIGEIKDAFINNGYSVIYENLVLKPASTSVTGMTMGTCLILVKDSIMTGVTYTCSLNQFGARDQLNRVDEFDLTIKKTSSLINDAEYKMIFYIDRIAKKQSDIF